MATSEPVRASIVELTRSMSDATSSARRSSDAWFGYSKGRTTAKIHLRALRKQEHRNAMLPGQGRKAVLSPHSDAAGSGQGIAMTGNRTTFVVRNSNCGKSA